MYFKNSTQEFTTNNIDGMVLSSQEKVIIEITAHLTNTSAGFLSDTLIAEFDCFSNRLAVVNISSGEPVIMASDYSTPQLSPFCNEHQITIEIKNIGLVPATIEDITLSNTEYFMIEATNEFPFVIEPGDSKLINNIYFLPNHQINLTTNTKANIICSNSSAAFSFNIFAKTASSIFLMENKDWGKQKINNGPYTQTVILKNYSDAGEVKIKSISLSNEDGFSIDQINLSNLLFTYLQFNEEKELKVYFTPTEEKNYATKLKIELEKCSNTMEVESDLKGAGENPSYVFENSIINANVYPNPASGNTFLQFSLPNESVVNIELFDSMGNNIAKIFSGIAEENKVLNITDFVKALASGAYFIRIDNGSNYSVINFSIAN